MRFLLVSSDIFISQGRPDQPDGKRAVFRAIHTQNDEDELSSSWAPKWKLFLRVGRIFNKHKRLASSPPIRHFLFSAVTLKGVELGGGANILSCENISLKNWRSFVACPGIRRCFEHFVEKKEENLPLRDRRAERNRGLIGNLPTISKSTFEKSREWKETLFALLNLTFPAKMCSGQVLDDLKGFPKNLSTLWQFSPLALRFARGKRHKWMKQVLESNVCRRRRVFGFTATFLQIVYTSRQISEKTFMSHFELVDRLERVESAIRMNHFCKKASEIRILYKKMCFFSSFFADKNQKIVQGKVFYERETEHGHPFSRAH